MNAIINIIANAAISSIIASNITVSTGKCSKKTIVPNNELPVNLRRIQKCQKVIWSEIAQYGKKYKHNSPTGLVFTTGKGIVEGGERIQYTISNSGNDMETMLIMNIARIMNYKGRLFYVTKDHFEEVPKTLINEIKMKYMRNKARDLGIEGDIETVMVSFADGTIVDLSKF